MMTYEKREVYEMLKELRDCIYEIEDIGWQEWKDSEDYDKSDEVRNKAMKILENLENYVDNVPLP